MLISPCFSCHNIAVLEKIVNEKKVFINTYDKILECYNYSS